jgi:hypothetical protein
MKNYKAEILTIDALIETANNLEELANFYDVKYMRGVDLLQLSKNLRRSAEIRTRINNLYNFFHKTS